MPELNIASPHVHSRVDSNTFAVGNPMPESTLTLSLSRLYPLVRDFGFGLWTHTHRAKTMLICCRWNRFLLYPPRSQHSHNGYLPFLSPDWQIEAVLISACCGEGGACIVNSSDNKNPVVFCSQSCFCGPILLHLAFTIMISNYQRNCLFWTLI